MTCKCMNVKLYDDEHRCMECYKEFIPKQNGRQEMGEAKRRGTYEERKSAAIKERKLGEKILNETKTNRQKHTDNRIKEILHTMGVKP